LAWLRDLTRGNAETMLGKGGVRFSFIRKRLLDRRRARASSACDMASAD